MPLRVSPPIDCDRFIFLGQSLAVIRKAQEKQKQKDASGYQPTENNEPRPLRLIFQTENKGLSIGLDRSGTRQVCKGVFLCRLQIPFVWTIWPKTRRIYHLDGPGPGNDSNRAHCMALVCRHCGKSCVCYSRFVKNEGGKWSKPLLSAKTPQKNGEAPRGSHNNTTYRAEMRAKFWNAQLVTGENDSARGLCSCFNTFRPEPQCNAFYIIKKQQHQMLFTRWVHGHRLRIAQYRCSTVGINYRQVLHVYES